MCSGMFRSKQLGANFNPIFAVEGVGGQWREHGGEGAAVHGDGVARTPSTRVQDREVKAGPFSPELLVHARAR